MIPLNLIFGGILALLLAAYFVSSNKRMAFLVVTAAFVTRPVIEIGPLNARLELLVGLLCLLRIVHDRLSRHAQPLSRSTALSVGATFVWLSFGSIASVFIAPVPQKSLSVLAWCVLNVLSALWVASTPKIWYSLIRYGASVAFVCSLLAIVFWLAATAHVFEFGVQVDPAYGGYAAFVFSLEANILGGLLCLWALVAIYNPLDAVPALVRVGLAVAAPVALLSTHTRAALMAYFVGLIACLIMRPEARKISRTSLLLGGLTAAIVLLSSSDAGLTKFFQVFDVEGGTGGLRYRVNSVAFTEWWNSPDRLVGLGWNSFGQRHIDETQPGLLLPGYIGNLPLQIAYDGGGLAVLSFGVAVIAVVIPILRNSRARLVVVFALPYLLFSVATSALWLLETWIFVGLAWGLCNHMGTARGPSKALPDTSRLGHLVVGVRHDGA